MGMANSSEVGEGDQDATAAKLIFCERCKVARFSDQLWLSQHWKSCKGPGPTATLNMQCPKCYAWVACARMSLHLQRFHEKQLPPELPKPPPPKQPLRYKLRRWGRLRVLQINVESLRAHQTELLNLFAEVNADVVLIQETWLRPNDTLSIKGWQVAARTDRKVSRQEGKEIRGGDILTLIREGVEFRALEEVPMPRGHGAVAHCVEVFASLAVKLLIANVYIPPRAH